MQPHTDQVVVWLWVNGVEVFSPLMVLPSIALGLNCHWWSLLVAANQPRWSPMPCLCGLYSTGRVLQGGCQLHNAGWISRHQAGNNAALSITHYIATFTRGFQLASSRIGIRIQLTSRGAPLTNVLSVKALFQTLFQTHLITRCFRELCVWLTSNLQSTV